MEPYVYVIAGVIALALIVRFVFHIRASKKIQEQGRPPITKKLVVTWIILGVIVIGLFVAGVLFLLNES